MNINNATYEEFELWRSWTLFNEKGAQSSFAQLVFILILHEMQDWNCQWRLSWKSNTQLLQLMEKSIGLQVHFSTFANHYCSTFWYQILQDPLLMWITLCMEMPAILPYFWKIFSTSVLTIWNVFRFPTKTLQCNISDNTLDMKCLIIFIIPTKYKGDLLFTAWGSWLLVWFPTLLTFILASFYLFFLTFPFFLFFSFCSAMSNICYSFHHWLVFYSWMSSVYHGLIWFSCTNNFSLLLVLYSSNLSPKLSAVSGPLCCSYDKLDIFGQFFLLPEDYLVSDLGAIRLKDILFHDLSREGADIEQQDLKGGTSR